MELWVASTKSVVGFAPVKELLARVQYVPETDDEFLGLSTILPDDDAVAKARTRASLTEAAKIVERIRFFKANRVARHFVKTGASLVRRLGPCQIHVARAENLDEGSRLFLETVSTRVSDLQVCLHLGGAARNDARSYSPSTREARIELLVGQPGRLAADGRAFLIDQVKLYLNCGDAWTADRILAKLRGDRLDSQVAFLSGLTYSLQMRTVESEFYYQRMSDAEQPVEVAWTCSALAMFYVRDHASHLHSMEHAQKLLEKGEQLLRGAPPGVQDIDWDMAFNRNTRAYFLVRKGNPEGAIAFLHECIAGLGERPADAEGARVKKFLIFKSLFVFNLSQCYRRLGRTAEAIATCNELLGIDPDYPEYCIEAALCHMAAGDYPKALKLLERARTLDATIPEIYSQMGVCWQELGDATKSLECHREARALEPGRPDMDYDYAYALSELNRYDECLEVLEQVDLGRASVAEYEDILSIKAESLANLNRGPDAIALLRQGIELIPSGNKLAQNLDQLERALSPQ